MKKFLSMALALAMALSLCTFVASPKADADFTDADELSSKYAEQAADVIQEIEVMDGYDDGSFRPTAGLTRQAAAKIICNMILGPTTARALPTNANPFPDVLAGNQFSGYISYCAQQGIISGYGDGTFRPGDPLSGYAYLKMLLGALGYDSNHEGFVGDNWKVNVAKIALGIGLNNGIDEELDGTTQVTRESAAIYAFNTLQADMVEYESKNTLEINGVKVSMGGGNAVPQTWNTSSTSIDNINDRKSDGANARPIVQFAERYFDKLERDPKQWDTYTQDDFGRPSIKWKWKGVEIGTYSRDPDAVFIGGVKVNEIYEALRQNTGMSSGDSTASLYINSDQANRGDPVPVAGVMTYPNSFTVERANDKDLADEIQRKTTVVAGETVTLPWTRNADTSGRRPTTAGVAPAGTAGERNVDRIGDGTIIEVFRNDANNHVDVCVISVYAGKVDAVKGATAKKDAYVIISPSDEWDRRPDSISSDSSYREFETEDFEEDDVVAYTYSDSAAAIQDMYLMSAESGALQSKVTTKSLRLDGTTYKYGKEYTFDDMKESDLSPKSSYVVYLDENDYVLWVEEDEFSVDDYVLVERISIETTSAMGTKTTTASVMGSDATNLEVDNSFDGIDAACDTTHQYAYNQTKSALGTSSWDARARLRYPNGTVRTLTLDDSKNYRTDVKGDANAVVTGTGPAATADKSQLANVDGDGNGNWIAEPFTAGHIVRLSSNSNGYRLHSINPNRFKPVEEFTISGNNIWTRNKTSGKTVEITAGGKVISADSETRFVIDDVEQGTYKSYVGVKNAPDVKYDATTGTYPRAYIYHNDGAAKLIYIVNGQNVTSSSNDIVFLVANSTSKLVESDDGTYYEISAVDKNEIKTLLIKEKTTFRATNGLTFAPGTGATEKESYCVILNNVSYDSNDFITKGSFDTGDGKDRAEVYHGVRRVNSEEIKVGTYGGGGRNKDVAENIRVYFVDGDNIERIDYSEIVNDSLDWAYLVQDSDGEVTYLFIVNCDDEAEPTATATVPVAALTVTSDKSSTFTIAPTDGVSVKAGTSFKFTVALGSVDMNAGLTISATYEGIDGNLYDTAEATYDPEEKVWSVVFPSGSYDSALKDGTKNISFTILED